MGGAEKVVCNLADEFAKRGHQVILISLTGQTINRPAVKEVSVVELGMEKTIASFAKNYRTVHKMIRDFSPDIVHSHMFHANIFARLLRLSTKMQRLICTAHNTNEGGRLRMLAYRLTDRLADLSTNVSVEAVQVFIDKKAAPANRMMAVHNGIETRRFCFDATARATMRTELGLEQSTPLLLAVGRLTAAKDYPNLLHAVAMLSSRIGHFRLVIIGTGELKDELQAMATSLGIASHVHFPGLRHDIPHWMSAADVFVLPSAWEGFGLVVAEAMACERVVVATDCGGVREVIGTAGIIVSPKNSKELAHAIEGALLMDTATRQELGCAARQRIEALYSLNTITERWLEIYQGKSCNTHAT